MGTFIWIEFLCRCSDSLSDHVVVSFVVLHSPCLVDLSTHSRWLKPPDSSALAHCSSLETLSVDRIGHRGVHAGSEYTRTLRNLTSTVSDIARERHSLSVVAEQCSCADREKLQAEKSAEARQ